MYLRTGNSVYGKLNTFFAETLIAMNIKNIIYIYIYNHSLQRVPPILQILLTFPYPTSRHLSLSLTVSKYITSICIKPCYNHLMKASSSQ